MMWFPHPSQKAIVKATGRTIEISCFLPDGMVFGKGSIIAAILGRLGPFKLAELKLVWPDFIPPGQRCNSTTFRMDAIE
jgi:hypothetical protein